MFDALAAVQRRRLLVALLDHNPQGDAPEATGDQSISVEQLVEIQHVHLPKLEEYGFIAWDEETHEVSKGPNFDEIGPLLKLLADHPEKLPPGWM